jgi:hypothetical protein
MLLGVEVIAARCRSVGRRGRLGAHGGSLDLYWSNRAINFWGLTNGPKLTAMRRSTSGQRHKVEQARAVVAQALGDAARRDGRMIRRRRR